MSELIRTFLIVLYGVWMLLLLVALYLTIGARGHARQAESYGLDSSRYHSLINWFRPYRLRAFGLLAILFAFFVFVDANFYPDEPKFFDPFSSEEGQGNE